MMKNSILAAALIAAGIFGTPAFANITQGGALTAAVLRMGTCYTEGGSIEFKHNGHAIVYSNGNGGGDSYSYSYGSENASDPVDSPYNSYAYGNPGDHQGAVVTQWKVIGSAVLLLEKNRWHSVTIGFRSATCTVN